jgi:hypothetical protein
LNTVLDFHYPYNPCWGEHFPYEHEATAKKERKKKKKKKKGKKKEK